ncbi:mannose-6-phosphate isomerase, class I [Demequina litorisediminis]|uniref:mannose-6-phosphate isomerase n=1 Tax=Demequina litorisediminis TaxID=1849022 RepID=A0ABQ6IEF6_9MICO|nr:mannose-6-phosphate isomerase, class I [Demequina litorisediminis]GMA35099.1 mannose-6-phosphate isomerase, class I [Demequina litorisediminis]
MQRITPVIRHYDWGTTDDIPRFLGAEPDGRPCAEAWWGAHTSAPSALPDEALPLALDERIAQQPEDMLGAEAAQRWGGRLPYLLKILAIAKPLSIQVHPTLDQAREGFALEQRGTGGAPHTFLDPFHKPEMVVAITPMRVLAGIRPLEWVAADLRTLDTDRAWELAAVLDEAEDATEFLRSVLTEGVDDATFAALATVGAASAPGTSLRAAADALGFFPADAGAVVALALNLVELDPGEAVYTGAGVLHSYQSGVGLEIMANSDNVVRAGLTPKHVDVPLLLTLADARPAPPSMPVAKARRRGTPSRDGRGGVRADAREGR